MNIENLIIIGSGPAGLTAAIYAARAGLAPLVFEGKNPGGQLMSTTYIENWPGEQRILGPQLMQNMRDHAQKLGAQLISDEVIQVDFSKQPLRITTHRSKTYYAHAVIIATGATPKKLGCEGEAEYWGKGVTTCAVCDGAFYKDKKVIIVGGGDTALENASFMTNFTKDITIVHILDALTASHSMQQRVINNPHITIKYNATVTKIEGNGSHVTHVLITDQKTKKTATMPVEGVFVSIGLNPNTALFKNQLELTKTFHIAQKQNTQTSIEGVFAAGDVVDIIYRQAIVSAGEGCKAALDAERFLKNREIAQLKNI